MKCERLVGLTKKWYIHVRDETMAPARMVQFLKNHVSTCEICQTDPDIESEIEKITEIILPESKIPKAVRLQQEQDDIAENAAREEAEEGEKSDDEDEDTVEEEEETEEYMDDDDDIEDDDLDDLD